jgi:hypothetical protein
MVQIDCDKTDLEFNELFPSESVKKNIRIKSRKK